MARQRRLNKNLVAFLTIAGMVLSVAVVAVASFNATRQDPEELAAKAKTLEEKGDLKGASERYMRAYLVDKEPKYAIESARCSYEMGEIGDALGKLARAHSQTPDDPDVLIALLTRWWEVRQSGDWWPTILETADKLLAIQPENLFGLVARAAALEGMQSRDPTYAGEAGAALDKAMAIDPTDPRVTGVRAQRVLNEGIREYIRLKQLHKDDEAQAALDASRESCITLLRESLEKTPDTTNLTTALARLYEEANRREECEALLTDAAKRLPEDEEIAYALAAFRLTRGKEAQDENRTDDAKKQVEEGLAAVRRAIEIAPAMYMAYSLRGELQRLAWELDGSWKSDTLVRQRELIDSMIQSLGDTVGLHTVRAQLSRGLRADLMAITFDWAFEFYRDDEDADAQQVMLSYMEQLIDSARAEFGEGVKLSLMEGQYAFLKKDYRKATQAFTAAEGQPGLTAKPQYELMTKRRLAQCYALQDEFGLALKYTDELIQWHRARAIDVPAEVQITKANLLNKLQRPQEALDVIDLMPEADRNSPDAARARSVSLAMLGREEESMHELEKVADSGADVRLNRAQLAAYHREFDQAEQLIRDVIESNPNDGSAIGLYVRVMIQAGKNDAGAKYLQSLRQRATEVRSQRLIDAYLVVLTTPEGPERQAKILELIETIPDPKLRAAEYFNYWYDRDEFAKAQPYLDELEKAQPDESGIWQMQFEFALRLKDFDRAEQYVMKLSDADADGAGGAVFRGQLKHARGDAEGALTDYRAAERSLPNDSTLKVRIAQALMSLEQAERAIEVLREALEINPRNFYANKLLFMVYDRIGRTDEGMDYLQTAWDLNPSDPDLIEYKDRIEEMRDPRVGIERREAVRAKEPDNVENLLDLVNFYTRMGDTKTAQERLMEAAQKAPGDRHMAMSAKKFFARTGNRAAGEQILRQYIEKRDRLGKVGAVIDLAEFYELLGDRAAVEATFAEARQMAIDLFGDKEGRGRRAQIQLGTALAKYYESIGQFDAMISSYRDILPRFVDSEEEELRKVRSKIIDGLMRLGRLSEADEEIQSFRKDYPKDPRGLVYAAQVLFDRNTPESLDEARELLSRVLEQYPSNAGALFMRGRVNMRLGPSRYAEAKRDLQKAKELAPNGFNLTHRMDLARLHVMLEEMAMAENELRELHELQPNDDRFSIALIRLLRNTGDMERAQTFVNELIAQQPKNPTWPYQLGRLLLDREQYSAAVQPLRAAVNLSEGKDPQYVADWLMALVRGQRAQEAIAALPSLPPASVTPAALTYIAEAHVTLNQTDAARTRMTQALHTAAANRIEILGYVAGRVREVLGHEQAVALLRAEMAGAGDNADVTNRCRAVLASELLAGGTPAEQKEAGELIDALVAGTQPPSREHLEGLRLAAQRCEVAHDYEGAVKGYERLLAVAPNSVGALNNVAYVLADKLGRPAEALPNAERARQLMPEEANVLDTLGWIHFKLEHYEQAESTLREAFAADSENVAVLYHLGCVCAQSGRNDEARRMFERAVSLAKGREASSGDYATKAREELAKLQ